MKILAVVAGTNEPSNVNVLCDAFLKGVKDAIPQAEIVKLRLKDLTIKHFSLEDYHALCTSEDDFCRLQEHVQSCDALVFATPVWNFSVPGHLKNVIDRMGAFCLDEETRTKGQLPGTPAYFLYTGGAPVAVWKGLMRFTTSHLPESIRYYGGTIIGKDFEGKCQPKRGTFALIVDQRPASLARVEVKGKSFGRIVDRYVQTKIFPLHFRIINRTYKIGQKIVAKF